MLERIQALIEAGDTVLVQDEENFILGQIYALKSATAFLVDQDFNTSITFAEKAAALLPRSEQGALGTALGYSAQSLQALGRREEGIDQLQQALADPRPQSITGPSRCTSRPQRARQTSRVEVAGGATHEGSGCLRRPVVR